MAKATTEAAAIVRIRIPAQLRSYTGGQSDVTIALPVLAPEHPIVDEQGRVRPHIKVFVGLDLATDLGAFVPGDREVMIVGALSGG
jgi:hypothetical protein